MKIKKFENFKYDPYGYKGCGCCPVCTGEKNCECICPECNFTGDYIEGEYEDDEDSIVNKIIEQFPYEKTKSKMETDNDADKHTVLIDMINWYEHNFKKIADEISVMKRLEDEYDFLK